AEIVVKEGDTVNVGALLGSISEGAAGGASAQQAAPEPKQDVAVAQASSPTAASSTGEAAAQTAKIAGDAGPVEPRTVPPAPSAAKLLAEHNLSADQIQGTGKRGQVMKGDVLDAGGRGGRYQPEGQAGGTGGAPAPA